MKIEELLELSTSELDAMSKDISLLEKHFGWCLEVTRPTEAAKTKLLAGSVKTSRAKTNSLSPKKLQQQAKANQLEAAQEVAKQMAAKLGLVIPGL